MAARATSKAKQADRPQASTKKVRAPSKAVKKAASRQSASAKSKGAAPRKPKATESDVDTAAALLVEQNEALRAELDQANARIAKLEALNKKVINRIDWVIDSLQGVLTTKR